MSEKPLEFTAAEVSHLLVLLERNFEDGIYSGPRDQYWHRHARIEVKLLAYILGWRKVMAVIRDAEWTVETLKRGEKTNAMSLSDALDKLRGKK